MLDEDTRKREVARYESLRKMFEKVFDSHWQGRLGDREADLREKYMFHMCEIDHCITELKALFDSHESVDVVEAGKVIYGFYLDAVPHLVAAAQIYDYVPLTFPEQLGVHDQSLPEGEFDDEDDLE